MSDNIEVNQENPISLKGLWNIEWTIKDIFSHTEKAKFHFSPEFFCLGSYWYLGFCANGNDERVALRVYMKRPTVSKTVNCAFYVKKWDGVLKNIKGHIAYKFGDDRADYDEEDEDDYDEEDDYEEEEDDTDEVVNEEADQFKEVLTTLKLAELQRRKSVLAPSGNFTVSCHFKDDSSYSSPLTQFCDNIKSLFVSKKFCDATLKVKDEEFSVHRCILAARSPVFEAMFEADMKEKKTGVVDIPDCQPNAFRDFLTYIYCGKSEDLYDNVFELYRIADKYDVQDLKVDCLRYIMNNVSVNNVFDSAILAHQFFEKELESIVQGFFCKNFYSIVHHDDWSSFSMENHTLVNELLRNMAKKAPFSPPML